MSGGIPTIRAFAPACRGGVALRRVPTKAFGLALGHILCDNCRVSKIHKSAVSKFFAGVSCLALIGTFSACGDNVDPSTSAGASRASHAAGPNEFYGAGASSQQGVVDAWISTYQKKNRDVKIAYNPTGSGAGVTTFLTGATTWAASDSPLNDEQVKQSKAVCASGEAFEVPVYLSPIAIVFNLRGVLGSTVSAEERHLNMDAATVARIFDGKITKWDDEAIKALNPLIDLPDVPITVVRRSDKSGTTQTFTSYLKAAAPSDWRYEPQQNWPNDVGQAAKGTDGVVTTVSQADGTIGYVDAAKRGNFGTVSLKVGKSYVSPEADAVAKVVDASPLRQVPKSSNRVVVDVNYGTDAKGSYPLALVSYAVACSAYKDRASGKFAKDWLGYIAGGEGQKVAQDNTGSAPLGTGLSKKVLHAISRIDEK